MNKAHSPISWENYPSEKTPINEENLNKMDNAIGVIDDRVIEHENKKATKEEVSSVISNVEYNVNDSVFKFTRKNGDVITVDIANVSSKEAYTREESDKKYVDVDKYNDDIEGLTNTKVSYADIVDALNSDASDLPLSAKQGKILYKLHFKEYAYGNVDEMFEVGAYWVTMENVSNMPCDYGVLEIVKPFVDEINSCLQRITQYYTHNIYTRMYVNNAWGEWTKHGSNIGTMKRAYADYGISGSHYFWADVIIQFTKENVANVYINGRIDNSAKNANVWGLIDLDKFKRELGLTYFALTSPYTQVIADFSLSNGCYPADTRLCKCSIGDNAIQVGRMYGDSSDNYGVLNMAHDIFATNTLFSITIFNATVQ